MATKPKTRPTAAAPHELDQRLLRGWPLPPLHDGADKEARGSVLVIAGSREMPGAAVLAGVAALHAGAGKLVIATGSSVALQVAAGVPEARVIGLPETRAGGFSRLGLATLRAALQDASAVLIGPGMIDAAAASRTAKDVLVHARVPVLLDAIAMDAFALTGGAHAASALLTPHAGEMAHLLKLDKQAVAANPLRHARDAAAGWRAVVALKGACSVIANPAGDTWRHRADEVGLATCGSGDVLAGIIVGLLARGAGLEQAAAWGVSMHAASGHRIAARGRPLGYLARELSSEIPALMHELSG